ncbi:MAG TPA: hypothetical protein VF188_00695 [Longimicrobiales bacterium]
MPEPLRVSVRYADATYQAAVHPEERADQLLLRSLHHFGIDPAEKREWRLIFESTERPAHGIYLDRPIGDQVEEGASLVLERDTAGNRRISTGSY